MKQSRMLLKSVTTLLILGGVITFAAANRVSLVQPECPTSCSLNSEPLCATDGKVYKEFRNACELQASNCRLARSARQEYTATAMDWCTTELVDNFQLLLDKLDSLNLDIPDCIKPCPFIYQPICISNGQYRADVSHKCLMDGINCALANKSKAAFGVLKHGIC